jgi:hypothetical protein
MSLVFKSDGFSQHCVRKQRASRFAWRRQLGHDAVAVRHQDGFAVGDQAQYSLSLLLSVFRSTARTVLYNLSGAAPLLAEQTRFRPCWNLALENPEHL